MLIPKHAVFICLSACVIAVISCGIETRTESVFLSTPLNLSAAPLNEGIMVTFTGKNFQRKFDGYNVYISTESSIRMHYKNAYILPSVLFSQPTIPSDIDTITAHPTVSYSFTHSQIQQHYTIQNGYTYYITVRAHDLNGNESGFSDEASTTPRPDGSCTLTCSTTITNGYSISNRGPYPDTDYAFGIFKGNLSGSVTNLIPLIIAGNGTQIIDTGNGSFNSITRAPQNGYIQHGELLPIRIGHIYILHVAPNNYVKLWCETIQDTSLTFQWAYQLDPGNKNI